ncbi:uncharacterized protein LOC117162876 [Bombus vancouverensis nearcticus]|uniref:uncharacterized protein LOC117162876 n=1 Tax=Bombus vancouverensis nearcticus TaxID=2705178 RepID=UPI0014391A17|nr:uncharacterized protein LOC117162876 [Bombus vancouverensis nearcticus]
MPNKKKTQNKPKTFCDRCHRVGHLARDCFTLMCDYCKRTGHDMADCRSFERDKKYIIDSARQYYRKYFANAAQSQGQPGTSSEISTEMSTLSTVGAYREYLTSPYKDVIEISTPELKGEKAKMMVSKNFPISMIKISTLKDDVTAAKEVLTLEDVFGAQIQTICLICLSIHVNNKTVLHPCRVISDDFYVETDGIFGCDFIARAKIKDGKHVELAGVRIRFIPNERVRGVVRINELVDLSNEDSDSETLTESGSELNS